MSNQVCSCQVSAQHANTQDVPCCLGRILNVPYGIRDLVTKECNMNNRFIVGTLRNNQLNVSQNPATHASLEDAKREVNRLLGIPNTNDGRQFVIFEAVATAELPPPTNAVFTNLK
jgi:hypothetical protein